MLFPWSRFRKSKSYLGEKYLAFVIKFENVIIYPTPPKIFPKLRRLTAL